MRAVLQALREQSDRVRGARNQGTVARPAGEPDAGALLKILYREDRRPEEKRHGTRLIHASSFCHQPKCARALCLGRLLRNHGVKFEEPTMGAVRLVWGFGRTAERHVRETLLSDPQTRRDALGDWHCKCGAHRVRGHLPPAPSPCAQCGGLPDRYGELTLFDPDLPLSGNPDLIIKQNGAYTVVEIKSVKDNTTSTGPGYADITSPMPKHVEQSCHYVRLMRRNGFDTHRKPLVLYVRKQFHMKDWYKIPTLAAPQLEQAEQEVRAAVETLSPYKDYLGLLEAEGTAAEPVPPAKLPECVADPEYHRKGCPHWIECMSHA